MSGCAASIDDDDELLEKDVNDECAKMDSQYSKNTLKKCNCPRCNHHEFEHKQMCVVGENNDAVAHDGLSFLLPAITLAVCAIWL